MGRRTCSISALVDFLTEAVPTDGPVGRLLEVLDPRPMRAAHIHLRVTADGITLGPVADRRPFVSVRPWARARAACHGPWGILTGDHDMGATDPIHERTDTGAGCPEVLTRDLSRNDVLDPVVEWPPAPPTRSTRTNGTSGGRDDTTVAQLAAGRAAQLLEASIDHLRTVLETSPDDRTSAAAERAIGEVADTCGRLQALTRDTALR